MRNARKSVADLHIRAEFWFALANRIYGCDIAQLPYGPAPIGIMGLRGRLASMAYNRGCQWQDRIAVCERSEREAA